jgi:hypothetical protein
VWSSVNPGRFTAPDRGVLTLLGARVGRDESRRGGRSSGRNRGPTYDRQGEPLLTHGGDQVPVIKLSNPLECTSGARRRTKVIGRLLSERSCLTLVWAVLDRASSFWDGLVYTRPPRGCSKTSATSCTAHPSGR